MVWAIHPELNLAVAETTSQKSENKDESSTSSEFERKYDELEDDLKESYKQVCGTLVKLGKENMVLLKEQRRLVAPIEVIHKELKIEKEEARHARSQLGETQKCLKF